MSLPFFYITSLDTDTITLDEDTSKHMIGVLRMEKDEEILLTDGKGRKAKAIIIDDNRKKCTVKIFSIETTETLHGKVSIGISLVKNSSRFEWFLEKATEIGVSEIVPLICERTEKEKFRMERMQNIITSAMLQSQQSRMPFLYEPMAFEKAVHLKFEQKYIAHCLPSQKKDLSDQEIEKNANQLILIGPEGDFTPHEIQLALEQNFHPVSLGNTRLRTETAGMVAAVLLCIGMERNLIG